MAARTCPACQRRYAGLVDPDCVICRGAGVLRLGHAGLHKNDPAVVARAIEGYLEAYLRAVDQMLPIGNAKLEALANAVSELVHAGLILDPLSPSVVPV
jgi:hypothetical protein